MGTIISAMIKSLSPDCCEKGENRTERYFEFRSKQDGLSDLFYTARSCIVSDTVEMKDEYRRKRPDEHLLARLVQAGWAVLGDAHEGVLNREY